jgi:hypothetical protein
MFHLNNNHQKQEHLIFSEVKYRRRSIIKDGQVLLAESVGPLHQQSNNSRKMGHENTVWSRVSVYMGCHILSSASHVISELVDITVCVTHQFHFDTYWGASVVGIILSSELSSMLSWVPPAN